MVAADSRWRPSGGISTRHLPRAHVVHPYAGTGGGCGTGAERFSLMATMSKHGGRTRSLAVVTALALAVWLLWTAWLRSPGHAPLDMSPAFDTRAPPQERRYEMVVTRGERAPDGIPRLMYLINGQFPGPTIEANEGDTIVVHLRNGIADNATFNTNFLWTQYAKSHKTNMDRMVLLHWHGLSMRGSQTEDGAGGFTSCALHPGEEREYRFKVHPRDVGTHWYHSHMGTSRADGLWGMFIVHSRRDERRLSGVHWDTEVPVAIGDHYHRPSPEWYAWYISRGSFGAEPVPDSGLINGQHVFNCEHSRLTEVPCPAQQRFGRDRVGRYTEFRLDPAKRARLRIVNVGAVADMTFSVDGHTLTVIEADGTLVQPMTVHRLPIAPGQRYSVVLNRVPTADGSPMPQRAWMRAEISDDCFQYTNPVLDLTTRAIVSYGEEERDLRRRLPLTTRGSPFDALDTLPTTRAWKVQDPEVPEEPCHDLQPGTLVPLERDPAPELRLDRGDQRIMLYTTVVGLNRWDEVGISYMNHSTWRPFGGPHGSRPPLLQRIAHGPGLTPEEWAAANVTDPEWELLASPHPSKPVAVEVVLNNYDDSPHPFHLHGHKFWVMETHEADTEFGGLGDWSDEGQSAHYQLDRAMKRDTVTVPMHGHVVLRWVADNPGVWAFHCHMVVHFAAGMGMAFAEMPATLQASPPPALSQCA